MTITTLPTPPNRASSPATFSAAADALLGALPLFVTEVNATATNVDAKAVAAAASASSANASAVSAVSAPATASTSTTSVTIGMGTKNFTTQSGKNIVPGMFLTAAFDGGNWMYGSVISYSGTALSINVIGLLGSGTYTSWSIALSAPVSPLNSSLTSMLGITGTAVGAIFAALSLANTSGTNGSAVLISLDPGNRGVGVRDCQIIALNDGGNLLSLLFMVAAAGPPTEVARFAPTGNFLLGTTSDDGVNKLQINGTAKINGIKHDVLSVNGVGSLRILKNVTGGSVVSGNAVAGSTLSGVYWTSGSVLTATSAPAGTWKNITGGTIANGEFGEWLRIA